MIQIISKNGFVKGTGSIQIIDQTNYENAPDGKLMMTAGTNLGGQRVVMISGGNAVYFDITSTSSIGKELGITNHAANSGDTIQIIEEGVMTSPGWGLTPNSVYYATTNGMLTTTAPNPGVVLQVGVALDANRLKVKFSEGFMTIT